MPKRQQKTMLDQLRAGIATNRLTNRLAVPFLVGAVVQVLYSFDPNPDTVTNWGEAFKMTLMGLGLMATPGTEPPK